MSFSASVAALVEASEAPLVQCANCWPRVELGSVARILNGFPFKSEYFSSSEGEPLIRIRDVTSGRTDTKYFGPRVDGYWVEAGELVVGMDGDFNSRLWSGDRALLNQRVCKITPDQQVLDLRFLAFLLPGYLALVNDATHSVTVKHLSSKTVQELPLPLPPVTEQRRIVAKLEALTARTGRARADLDRVPALGERFRLAALATAYGPLLEVSEPLIGLVDPARGIPYGIIQTGSPARVGVATVRCGDVKAFGIKRDALKIVAQEIADGYQRTLLRGGEVLLAIRGSVGEAAVAGPDLVGCNISREVAMIPVAARLRPKFLMYYIGSPSAQSYLKRHVKGVAQTGINLQDVRTLSVPVPDLLTQDAVVAKIEAAFAEIDRLVAEAAAARRLLDRLDQAILAKAFRGDLVPQDPAEEPASVLLDRIRAERASAPTKARRGRQPAGVI